MAQAQFETSLACPLCFELSEKKEDFFKHILTAHDFKVDKTETMKYQITLNLCHSCLIKNRRLHGSNGVILIYTLCKNCEKVNIKPGR